MLNGSYSRRQDHLGRDEPCVCGPEVPGVPVRVPGPRVRHEDGEQQDPGRAHQGDRGPRQQAIQLYQHRNDKISTPEVCILGQRKENKH